MVISLVLATLASAQERPDRLPLVAIEDYAGGPSSQLLSEAAGAPPIAIRLRIDHPDGLSDPSPLPSASNRVPLWVVVPAPDARAALDAWGASIRRIVDRTADTLVALEIEVDMQPADVVEFAVKLAATELHARREGVRIALGGPAMEDEARRVVTYSAAVAPYVDLLAISEARRSGIADWLQRIDPEARIVLTGRSVPSGQDAATTIVEAIVDDLGTDVVSHAWRASDVTPAVMTALRPLGALTTHELTSIDAGAVDLRVTANGAAPPPTLRQRLLFDTATFSTLFVYWGGSPSEALSVSLHVPLAGTPSVTDLIDGTRSAALAYTRDDATETSSVRVPASAHPLLIDFSEGVAVVGEQSGVSAERVLSVGEIIARHRRQQLAQDRLVRNYIADSRMRQFFRPQLTDAGYDVVIENRYFVSENDVEWEQRSFAVNNRHWSIDQPFPMLQPEKVFALPLQLRFDEGYAYRLEGIERIDGRECYNVRFDPMRDDPTLYRGNVWIDRRTFARIQLHAVQGGLPGMVISNDETQHYAPVATIGNQPIFLLSGVSNREIMLLAGRNIPFEKHVTFSGFRLNDPRFDEERSAARQSDRMMYRETENGLRPYVKQNGTRVVVDQQTPGVKAMALGTVVDPSYRFPLPIFGINIVDFNFGNRNTQLAMLFAGVLAAGNIQRPQLFGAKNLSASVDFFAIAAPSSDRVYQASGESESARLNTWPMSTGLNLGWQATPFQKLSAQYQFRFDGYAPDTTTSESFQRPSSTVTNGIGGQWEYARNGYSVVLNAAWFARASWRPWGDPEAGTLVTTSRTYAKYQLTVSRDFLFSVFQKFNVNAAWFGGHDLDRFVQYQFGLFDATRIHGVPGAVRFGELAMTRGSYSFNVFDQYRLDLFLDYAWGRDHRGDDWGRIPGIGTAFNLPGPWNTIVRADVGKSWLPDRYGTLGSTVAQIMLLKPLR